MEPDYWGGQAPCWIIGGGGGGSGPPAPPVPTPLLQDQVQTMRRG